MRAYSPVLATILLVFCVITLLPAEETQNPDGTYTSTTTIDDVTQQTQKASAIPPNDNHALQRVQMTQAEADKRFPGEVAEREKKAEERANMTAEERAKEIRMLDREPPSAGVKVNNPNMTETNSIPKRS